MAMVHEQAQRSQLRAHWGSQSGEEAAPFQNEDTQSGQCGPGTASTPNLLELTRETLTQTGSSHGATLRLDGFIS